MTLLHVHIFLCSLLSAELSNCLIATWTAEGGGQTCFCGSWMSSRAGKLFKGKVYRERKHLGFFREGQQWMQWNDNIWTEEEAEETNWLVLSQTTWLLSHRKPEFKKKICWPCKQNKFVLFSQPWGKTQVGKEQMWRPMTHQIQSEWKHRSLWFWYKQNRLKNQFWQQINKRKANKGSSLNVLVYWHSSRIRWWFCVDIYGVQRMKPNDFGHDLCYL